ncbi:MAG: hypothetical protein HYV27_05935 [Candidatus Hydrogenedentes bacterium]|nr:hypothetical protein [Candidatus Hydrogenedentota bacterium]
MQIRIDGEQKFELLGDAEDVLAAVGAVNEYLRGGGRAILSLVLNGETITPENMAKRLTGMPLSDSLVLEVGSEALETMIETCLKELQEVLPELPEACRSLARVFQGDRPEDGFDPFIELANIWSLIKRREMLIVTALELKLDALKIGDAMIAEMHHDLNVQLEEAADALKRNDCVLLGDLLEYELAPRAEQEIKIVNLIQEQASAQQG